MVELQILSRVLKDKNASILTLNGITRDYFITYQEEYFGEVEYVYNDSWYTTESVVLQEEEAGFHEVTALVTKQNGTEEGRELIHEEVIKEPVCKRVEVGTQTPPTYIKPLSGGRQTSGYG